VFTLPMVSQDLLPKLFLSSPRNARVPELQVPRFQIHRPLQV
jgi:hypothetical protein